MSKLSTWILPSIYLVASLAGLTEQAHCLSGNFHYGPRLNYLLTKRLFYGCLWKMEWDYDTKLLSERYFYMHSEKSSLHRAYYCRLYV